MENTTEKEMMDVLAYTGCVKMPRAINPVKDQSRVWIKAIARIQKITGAESYAVLRNDYGRRPRIIKTFGESASIAKIVSIHPFEWLRQDIIPQFRSEAERDAYLVRIYRTSEERIASLSQADKDRLFYTHLMDAQAEYDKNRKDM